MNNTNTTYTRREVDLFIVNLHDKFDAWDIRLEGIYTELKRLNGTVANNKSCIDELETWRDRLAGGLIVLSLLVVPIIIYFIERWIG